MLRWLLTSKYFQAQVLGWARAALAAAVPVLISAGYLQQNQANDFLGAGCFFASLALSALDKAVVNRKLQVAAATGVVPSGVNLLRPAPQATMQPIANPVEFKP